MFTDRNNNKIPDCVERTAIIAAASTMLLTGCGTPAAASDIVTESCIGTLEECDAKEMMKKIEVDNSGILTKHTNFANYFYLVDTGIVYFIGFDSLNPKAITPVISTNGNYIRYNEETQSCEEVINSNDKSEVARNFEDTNSDEKSLLNKVSAF